MGRDLSPKASVMIERLKYSKKTENQMRVFCLIWLKIYFDYGRYNHEDVVL